MIRPGLPMSTESKAPIIIKRKKVIEAGHHGGAWKVAYADFVTAMMAFFLLMWLLGATNEKQRKGIADYFNPSIPVNKVSGGGDGAFGGDSVFIENTLAHTGTGASTNNASASDDKLTELPKDESKKLQEVADLLSADSGESMVSEILARHIVTRISDEGLIVELFDLPNAPLFESGSAPTETLNVLLRSVYQAFRLSDSPVAIQAHAAAVPIVSVSRRGWDTTSDRSNAARRILVQSGMREGRIARVSGFADRKPAARDPISVRNNRIELILLRSKL